MVAGEGSPCPGRGDGAVPPQSPEVVQAVGKLSYNQLVEKIIRCKQASDSSLVSEGTARRSATRARGSRLVPPPTAMSPQGWWPSSSWRPRPRS